MPTGTVGPGYFFFVNIKPFPGFLIVVMADPISKLLKPRKTAYVV